MRKLIILLSIVAIGTVSRNVAAERQAMFPAFPFKTFEINRGTNLAHCCLKAVQGEQRAMFITERDIRFIDSVALIMYGFQ